MLQPKKPILEKLKAARDRALGKNSYTKESKNKYTGSTTTTNVMPRKEKEKVQEASGDYSLSKKKLNKDGSVKKDVTKYYDSAGKLKDTVKLKFNKLKNSNQDGPNMTMKVVKKSPGEKRTVKKTEGYGMPLGTKKMDEVVGRLKNKD